MFSKSLSSEEKEKADKKERPMSADPRRYSHQYNQNRPYDDEDDEEEQDEDEEDLDELLGYVICRKFPTVL